MSNMKKICVLAVVLFLGQLHANFSIVEIEGEKGKYSALQVPVEDLSAEQREKFYTSVGLEQFSNADAAQQLGLLKPVHNATNSRTGDKEERNSVSDGITIVLVRGIPHLLLTNTEEGYALPGGQDRSRRVTSFIELANQETTEEARFLLTGGASLFTGYTRGDADRLTQGFVTQFVSVDEADLKEFLASMVHVNTLAKADFDAGQEGKKARIQQYAHPHQEAQESQLVSLDALVHSFSSAIPRKATLQTLDLVTGDAAPKEFEFRRAFTNHFDTGRADPHATLLKTFQAALDVAQLIQTSVDEPEAE